MNDWKHTVLGRSSLRVGRLGLAASYGADERCVELAFERGVNYLYWGSRRTESFGAGLRKLRSRRDAVTLVIQSYSRVASLVPWSLERALRQLQTDYADVLLLGMWNKDVPAALFDRALQLRERGLVRQIAVSTHKRSHAVELAQDPEIGIIHIRYNAIHTGAERDIFPHLPQPGTGPGIVSFTATSWGELLKPHRVASADPVPTAEDCYWFVLTNPSVQVCLTGPSSIAELTAALDAWDKGPMSSHEMTWMRRVGESRYRKAGLLSLKR